jgi:hypothetical protein
MRPLRRADRLLRPLRKADLLRVARTAGQNPRSVQGGFPSVKRKFKFVRLLKENCQLEALNGHCNEKKCGKLR